jgi:CheY-like chemotaxis protein
MTINVYYLDDDSFLCELFSELVGSETINVTTFTDADIAIEACNKNPPQVFFIDYRLPSTTGDEVAFAIDNNIPKVLVSGDLFLEPEYKFIKIISKPTDFKLVHGLISSHATT